MGAICALSDAVIQRPGNGAAVIGVVRYVHKGQLQRREFLGFGFTALFAGIGQNTGRGIGGLCGDFALVPFVLAVADLFAAAVAASVGVLVNVSQSGNRLLCNLVVTAGAVAALGETGLRAGGGNSLVGDQVMSKRRNRFLCNLVVTAGAVAALRQTGFGTGGGNSFVGDQIVTQRRNRLLCNLIVTTGAVAALRQAGFGTGRGNGFVGDHVMSKRRNRFLCNLVVAAGTMAAFGETCLRASSRNCLVCDHSMSQRRNGFLFNKNLATNGAMFAFSQTRFRAGRRDCIVSNYIMSAAGNENRPIAVAAGAGTQGIAPGAGGRHNRVRISMVAVRCAAQGVPGLPFQSSAVVTEFRGSPGLRFSELIRIVCGGRNR